MLPRLLGLVSSSIKTKVSVMKSTILDTKFICDKFNIFCVPSMKILDSILDIFLRVGLAVGFCPDHSIAQGAIDMMKEQINNHVFYTL
jgi:hypothetical protein